MVTDVFRLLLHVADVLDRLDLRYVVGGSLASGVHGELRATNDIDVLVELTPTDVPRLVAALKPSFDVWEDTVQGAVGAGRSFGVLHMDWHVKVDFFPSGASPLDEPALRRREATRLPAAPDHEVFVMTAEDIVLRKLEWFRRSGDVLERQLRDIVGVLKLQGDSLDGAYVRAWAATLGVEGLLDRCIEDARRDA